jgi:hypothetical protein
MIHRGLTSSLEFSKGASGYGSLNLQAVKINQLQMNIERQRGKLKKDISFPFPAKIFIRI